ncbi:adenine phosphoribosyltransferase [Schizopora paradoxa]|uniref:adenine phosphoribosyltransferase n=1 Tax=Schizopora paradoxa TaxID=27342 RepID=A0A0H2RWA6_9AGAM|nr:adenine phosphoribosyltransferase [Schizopora paradoxa]
MADVELLKSLLGVHPGFPKPGITFLDFLPILRDPTAFETLLTHFMHRITTTVIPSLPPSPAASTSNGSNTGGDLASTSTIQARPKIDAVVGLDARGFLLGPPLALRLGAAFVPVRKRGKLPGVCVQAVYEKEYGEDIFEMQAGSIQPGQNVLVVDDLIATGGSAKAAGELVAKQGGRVVQYLFVISIPFLRGIERLDAPAYAIIESKDD